MTVNALEPHKLRDWSTLDLQSLSSGGTITQLHHLLRSVTVQQSVYNPTVRTEFALQDGRQVFDKLLPVQGEEVMLMGLVDSGGRSADLVSHMYTMTDMITSHNGTMNTYGLVGQSLWMQENYREKVRKTFKDMKYSDMIVSLCNDYLGESPKSVDTSTFEQKRFFCPQLSPLQVIDILLKRAHDNNPGFWVLHGAWSTGIGQHLRLSNLYNNLQQGPKWTFRIGDGARFSDTIDGEQIEGKPTSRVTSWSYTNMHNAHDLTHAGFESRQYDKIDIFTRNYIQVEDKGNRPTYLSDSPIHTGAFRGSHMQPKFNPNQRTRFQMVDTDYYRGIDNTDTLDKSIMSMPLQSSLTQKDLTIITAGNLLVQAGDVVEVLHAEVHALDEDRAESKRLSGNYLVTSKTDTFTNTNEHFSKLVLSRESHTPRG